VCGISHVSSPKARQGIVLSIIHALFKHHLRLYFCSTKRITGELGKGYNNRYSFWHFILERTNWIQKKLPERALMLIPAV
jgi:hypothetical protein